MNEKVALYRASLAFTHFRGQEPRLALNRTELVYKEVSVPSRTAVLLLVASFVADPFVGKWKVIPSKSQLNDEMMIQVAGTNKYILTFGPGAADTIVADGTEQRALGGTTLSMAVRGPNGWRVVRKLKNSTLLSADWRLSANGDTLTDDYTQYENDAPKLTVHYIYERTAGSSGLAGTWDSGNAKPDGDIELQIKRHKENGLSFVMHGLTVNENITFDGKAPSGDGKFGRRASERSLEITERARGKVRQIQHVELSPDLATLTMTLQLVGQNKPLAILVFERQ